MPGEKHHLILEFVEKNPLLSSKEIHDGVASLMALATVKRVLKGLIHHSYCPLSYRTVDTLDFKKALLLFYEQNNLTAIKSTFYEQYEFAVNTYF